MKTIFKTNYLLYALPYSISFIFVLLTGGVFWDDWLVLNVPAEARLNIYNTSGRPLYAHLFNSIFFLDPSGSYLPPILTFLSFLSVMFILDNLLARIKEISSTARVFIVVFFGIFPVNFSRISITILQYTLCYALFFVAFKLTATHLKKPNALMRLSALTLFYLSFTMESLLMFFALVLFFIGYENKEQLTTLKKAFKVAVRHLDFLLLPLIFFAVKITLFQPSGKYVEYNKVGLQGFLNSFNLFFPTIKTSFITPLEESLNFVKTHPLLIVLSSLLTYYLLKLYIFRKPERETLKSSLMFLMLSPIMFFLATFPYLAVGITPGPFDWDSRHQILVPLAAAFFLYYFFHLVFECADKLIKVEKLTQKLKLFTYSFLISSFVWINFNSYLHFQKDWLKQLSLIENFKSNKEIRDNKTFFFIDNTVGLNARNRTYRFYEFTGQMKLAFGNEVRYGARDKNVNSEEIVSYIPHPQYNLSNYVLSPIQYNVTIDYGSFALTGTNILRILYSKAFDKDEYFKMIKNILVLKTSQAE